MTHGASEETIARLRWHAGLVDTADPGIPSVAASTWPPGEPSAELEPAVDDVIITLDRLNCELNGAVPSEGPRVADVVPISVAYAVAEIARMLREHGKSSAPYTWAVETAWLAVLAGDIDDLGEHLDHERWGGAGP